MKRFFRVVFLIAAIHAVPCEDFPKLKIANNASASVMGYDHEIWRWNYVRSRVSGMAEIQYRELGSEAYFRTLAAQGQAGTLPDVFSLGFLGQSDFINDQHLAKDLRPLLKETELKGFMPQALDSRYQRGAYLAVLPYTLKFSPVLLVNTAVLTGLGLKPAGTVEELKAQVPVLAKAGFLPVVSLWEPGETRRRLFNLMAGRLGGEGMAGDLHTGQLAFTDGRVVSLLTAFQDLVRTVGGTESAGTSPEKPLTLWAANKAAYLLADDSVFPALVGDKKRGPAPLVAPKEQSKIVITSFPRFAQELDKAPEAVCAAGPGFALSAALEPGSKKEAAALEVARTLSSVFAQDDRLKTHFAFPSRFDVPPPRELDPVELVYLKWLRSLKGGVPALELTWSPTQLQALDQALADVALGRVAPGDAAKTLQKAGEKNRR